MRACQKNVNRLASSEIKVLLAIQLIFVTLMKPHRYRKIRACEGREGGGAIHFYQYLVLSMKMSC